MNEEHVALVKQGAEAWIKWRFEHTDIIPNLLGADFSGLDLSEIDLSGCNLSHTSFHQADLGNATFGGSNLYAADFHGSYLEHADFVDSVLTRADLSRANLREANLLYANFNVTNIYRADFTRANIGKATFRFVNLGAVRGIGTVFGADSATIGFDTWEMSLEGLPEDFFDKVGYDKQAIKTLLSSKNSRSFVAIANESG